MSLLLIIWCHPLQDSHSHNEVHGHLLDHISTIMIITLIVLIIGYIATLACHVASPDYLPLPFARPPKELDHPLDHHDHDLTPHTTLTHAM